MVAQAEIFVRQVRIYAGCGGMNMDAPVECDFSFVASDIMKSLGTARMRSSMFNGDLLVEMAAGCDKGGAGNLRPRARPRAAAPRTVARRA